MLRLLVRDWDLLKQSKKFGLVKAGTPKEMNESAAGPEAYRLSIVIKRW